MAKKIIIEDVELGNSGEASKDKINNNFKQVGKVLDTLDGEAVKKIDVTTRLGFSQMKVPCEYAVSLEVQRLQSEIDHKPNKEDVAISMINKGSVTTISNLPTNATKGDAYYVESEGFIYQYDGSKWNKTAFTAFPSDVATKRDVGNKCFIESNFNVYEQTIASKFLGVSFYNNNPDIVDVTLQRYSNGSQQIGFWVWNANNINIGVFYLYEKDIVTSFGDYVVYEAVYNDGILRVVCEKPDNLYLAIDKKTRYILNNIMINSIEKSMYDAIYTLDKVLLKSILTYIDFSVAEWVNQDGTIANGDTSWCRSTPIKVQRGMYVAELSATNIMGAVIEVDKDNNVKNVLVLGNFSPNEDEKRYSYIFPIEKETYISLGTSKGSSSTCRLLELSDIFNTNIKSSSNQFALPEYVNCPIGRNTDIFLDGISCESDSNKSILISGSANIKRTSNGILRYNPAIEETLSVIFAKTDESLNERYRSTVKFRSIPINGDGSEKNICIGGDSLINSGWVANEAFRLLADDNDFIINQIGTKTNANANHEGRGSWSWAAYINPLYENTEFYGHRNAFMIKGKLNFKQYMINNFPTITPKIDIFFMALGTNDIGQGISIASNITINTIVEMAKQFIDAFIRDFPNGKFIVGLPSVGAPVFPDCTTQADVFRMSIQLLNQKYIEVFDNGKYHSNVTCCLHGAYIDRYNSFPYVDELVNDYITDVNVRRFMDSVHPTTIGYKQWGRGIYGGLRGVINS